MIEINASFSIIPSLYDIGLFLVIMFYLWLSIQTAKFFKKRGEKNEVTRKITHILWGSVIFFLLVIKNYLISFLVLGVIVMIFESKNGKFRILDKETYEILDRSRSTKGAEIETTMLEISGLLTIVLFYIFHREFTALAAYGAFIWLDGIAGIIGRKYGRIEYMAWDTTRTIEGSIAGFTAGSVIIGAIYTLMGGELISLAKIAIIPSTIAAITEALSPEKYDNLTTPVTTYLALELLLRF